MVASELLVLSLPIFFGLAIGMMSESGMLGLGVGILTLSYIAINSGNTTVMGAFILVIVFMGLATAVYLTSMVMGEYGGGSLG